MYRFRSPGWLLTWAISMLFCVGLCAGAKKRPWQDGQVLRIQQTEEEYETVDWRSTQPIGKGGALTPAGTTKRRVKIWTYFFKSAGKVYSGKAEKKPLPGVELGFPVKICQQKDDLFVLCLDGKERRLDFLKVE